MAGIGFALRSFAQRDELSASMRGYSHAAFVSAGPWLFTVIALASIDLFSRERLAEGDLLRFSTIVIYNFAFSLVLSGPLVLVLTRHLSDRLYAKDTKGVSGMLVGGLLVLWAVQLCVGIGFVETYTVLPRAIAAVAVVGFLLTGGIWLVALFLSALRSYETISAVFGLGMVTGFGLAAVLMEPFGLFGVLSGFTVGLAVIFFALTARVLAEYPGAVEEPFAFVRSFGRYWELALAGLFYNAAIWVDKVVMWFAPGRRVIEPGLVANPTYDSAMFFAYLSIVPALTIFLVSVETQFFEHYVRFYRDLRNHATLQEIRRNHKAVIGALMAGFRNVTVIQSVLCYLAILVAPGLIGMAKGGLELVPIFRYGVLGALFHNFGALLRPQRRSHPAPHAGRARLYRIWLLAGEPRHLCGSV
jgi:polysaccharide biosynthesis protein PelG